MFKGNKGKGMVKSPSPLRAGPSSFDTLRTLRAGLRNPQALVVTLDPLYAAKYASIIYTPHGWIGINRSSGGEELLPREAFKLRRVDELVGDD